MKERTELSRKLKLVYVDTVGFGHGEKTAAAVDDVMLTNLPSSP